MSGKLNTSENCSFFFWLKRMRKGNNENSYFIFFLFNPTEPVPTILPGTPDLYVEEGSTINLTCTIRFGPEPVGHIFWYHENKVSMSIIVKLKDIKRESARMRGAREMGNTIRVLFR